MMNGISCREKHIFLLVVVTYFVAIFLTLIGLDFFDEDPSFSSLKFDRLATNNFETLTGLKGIVLLLFSVVISPAILQSAQSFLFGLVLLAWISIPFMINLTKKIPLWRRIPYVYFFVTSFALVVTFAFIPMYLSNPSF